jgi:hypothetical protein
MKKYRVWAGEGEGQGTIEGYANTLTGAKRIATKARCNGDRWAFIEVNLEDERNSMGQELTGWMRVEDNN